MCYGCKVADPSLAIGEPPAVSRTSRHCAAPMFQPFLSFPTPTYIEEPCYVCTIPYSTRQSYQHYLSIMAESALQNHCLHIPTDHRLRSLLRPDPPTPDAYTGCGKHALILERYGRDLRISLPEIQHAKTLAKPETKGGVLVLLQQPAHNQQYDGRDFDTIIQECETLRAVDNVLRAVVGSSLKETSCFDAFPFQKVPVPTRSETGYFEYDEAYNVCREMTQQKQPDVVLCCYQSPDTTKFNLLYSLGVGKMRTYDVRLGDRLCKPVNAFHPSYAVNYNKSESCFRSLYMLEALQAFHKVNGTWTEREWMSQLRSFCKDRAKELVRGKSMTNHINTIFTFPQRKTGFPNFKTSSVGNGAFKPASQVLKNLSASCAPTMPLY